MKYALLVHAVEPLAGGGGGLDSAAYGALVGRLRADGSLRGARRFAPAAAATTVRNRGGKPFATAGPASREGEPLAGFVVVECRDEDAAAGLAGEVAVATRAVVEVRPVARPGEGGPDKAGVAELRAGAALKEYAFVINVADERRPWPGNPAFEELMENCGKVLSQLEAAGRFCGTERLVPSSTAKNVRVAGGRRTVTDGPFTEARELIGGFILGECESDDEAVALAGQIPGAASGSVEVRQVVGE